MDSVASYQVPEHHVKMYTDNVRGAIARKGGLLYPLVSQAAYRGERIQVVNFIGPITFTERTSVYADTEVSQLEHKQRWITGKTYDAAVLVDSMDKLKMIYDPMSPYVERMREAAVRKMDSIVMAQFFATARTGVDGTTDTAYATGNTVAHGGTGLTVAKLRSLRKLMKKAHIDLRGMTPMVAVTADQIDNLLGEVAVGSSDYNAVKPLVDGEVNRFMGFTFVPYEDYAGEGIPKVSTTRMCPAWVSDGMHFGVWDALNVIIGPRADKNNIPQAHATFSCGATRVEEEKVFQVECTES